MRGCRAGLRPSAFPPGFFGHTACRARCPEQEPFLTAPTANLTHRVKAKSSGPYGPALTRRVGGPHCGRSPLWGRVRRFPQSEKAAAPRTGAPTRALTGPLFQRVRPCAFFVWYPACCVFCCAVRAVGLSHPTPRPSFPLGRKGARSPLGGLRAPAVGAAFRSPPRRLPRGVSGPGYGLWSAVDTPKNCQPVNGTGCESPPPGFPR